MDNLEPVKVATLIASSILGPTVASVVGPYSVIILAASLGAAWSLGAREEDQSIGSALWFFIRINLTAILVTVFIASHIGKYLGITDSTWLLAPVALVIGGIGDNWIHILTWAVETIKSFITKKTSGS